MRTWILLSALAVLAACGPSVTLSTDVDHYTAGVESVILLLENDSPFEIYTGDLLGADLEQIATDGTVTVVSRDVVVLPALLGIPGGSQLLREIPLDETLEEGQYRWRHAYGDQDDATRNEVVTPVFHVEAAP